MRFVWESMPHAHADDDITPGEAAVAAAEWGDAVARGMTPTVIGDVLRPINPQLIARAAWFAWCYAQTAAGVS